MSAAQNLSISLACCSGTSLLLSGTAVTVGSLSNWPAAENTVKVHSFNLKLSTDTGEISCAIVSRLEQVMTL